MNKRIVYRGMEQSDVLEVHVEKQLAKIEEFLANDRTPQSIDIVFEAHPNHAHNKCEIRIKTPSYNVIAYEEGKDLNKLVDQVLDMAYRELRRQKEKQVDKDKHGCVQDCTELMKRQLNKDDEE